MKTRTGLVIDAFFSGTKIKRIIDHVYGLKDQIREGKVCMGTIDFWLMWKLSNGAYHVTDYGNASRTMLLNAHTRQWDDDLFSMLDIPRSILPELKPTSGEPALTDPKHFSARRSPYPMLPEISMLLRSGRPVLRRVWQKTPMVLLALMMNIDQEFIGGAAVQWLRDGLHSIEDAKQCDILAAKVPDTGGVYMVPAFTGFCAPYWDMYARSLIIGITVETEQAHIARGALESMAYQTKDAMIKDLGISPGSLRVDGGVTKSSFRRISLGFP